MSTSIPHPGKVCTKCKEWKDRFRSNKQTRDGLASWCRDCEAALARKAYANDPVKSKETTRKYRAEHAEQERVRMREYNAQYYEEHLEETKRKAREYHHQHPDEVRTRRKAYKSTPVGRTNKRVAHQRRRAIKKNADGNHTSAEWLAMLDWFGNVCLKCGTVEDITEDHVIPLTKGGSNSIDNMQPLCRYCNVSKGNRSSADYRNAEQLAAFLSTLA
jgi:5-methylcytosine-specific restriction endonuclease McrA